MLTLELIVSQIFSTNSIHIVLINPHSFFISLQLLFVFFGITRSTGMIITRDFIKCSTLAAKFKHFEHYGTAVQQRLM